MVMDEDRLREIFFSDENDRLRKQFFSSQDLVHYTTAENALNILKGEVWLRNTRVMNDVAEIHHGASLIDSALHPSQASVIRPALKEIGDLLDMIHSNITTQVLGEFSSNRWNFVNRTYVTCLSVHGFDKEEHGRLSMWRAYTGAYAGIALVLDPTPFTQLVERPSFFSVPVSYDTDTELALKLQSIANTVRAESAFIASQPRDTICWFFSSLLRKIATASKHHGFREEQEWRVMHTRNVDPSNGLSYEVQSVRGIPQVVTKLSLKQDGPFAILGLTVPRLLRRVIIGPTNYPFVVAEAIQNAMENAGIPDAESRITISKIPLRMESV